MIFESRNVCIWGKAEFNLLCIQSEKIRPFITISTKNSSKLSAEHLILSLHVIHSMPVRKLHLGRLWLWPDHCSFRMVAPGCSEDTPRNPMHRNHPENPPPTTSSVRQCRFDSFLAARHHALFCSALNCLMLQSNQLYAPLFPRETRWA